MPMSSNSSCTIMPCRNKIMCEITTWRSTGWEYNLEIKRKTLAVITYPKQQRKFPLQPSTTSKGK